MKHLKFEDGESSELEVHLQEPELVTGGMDELGQLHSDWKIVGIASAPEDTECNVKALFQDIDKGSSDLHLVETTTAQLSATLTDGQYGISPPISTIVNMTLEGFEERYGFKRLAVEEVATYRSQKLQTQLQLEGLVALGKTIAAKIIDMLKRLGEWIARAFGFRKKKAEVAAAKIDKLEEKIKQVKKTHRKVDDVVKTVSSNDEHTFAKSELTQHEKVAEWLSKNDGAIAIPYHGWMDHLTVHGRFDTHALLSTYTNALMYMSDDIESRYKNCISATEICSNAGAALHHLDPKTIEIQLSMSAEFLSKPPERSVEVSAPTEVLQKVNLDRLTKAHTKPLLLGGYSIYGFGPKKEQIRAIINGGHGGLSGYLAQIVHKTNNAGTDIHGTYVGLTEFQIAQVLKTCKELRMAVSKIETRAADTVEDLIERTTAYLERKPAGRIGVISTQFSQVIAGINKAMYEGPNSLTYHFDSTIDALLSYTLASIPQQPELKAA